MLLEEEICDVIKDILERVEEQVRPVHGAWKMVSTVEVGGHCIYKSTHVSQFNGSNICYVQR